jgi:hypothetical protein
MASDFSGAWQFLSKRTIGFSLWIKLHAREKSSPKKLGPFRQFKKYHKKTIARKAKIRRIWSPCRRPYSH